MIDSFTGMPAIEGLVEFLRASSSHLPMFKWSAEATEKASVVLMFICTCEALFKKRVASSVS